MIRGYNKVRENVYGICFIFLLFSPRSPLNIFDRQRHGVIE